MQITRGKKVCKNKIVIYGQEGVGKTTLASKFPNPVFIDVEDGTSHLDVARTPKPSSFSSLISIVSSLTQDAQGFKTLVIDTLDWAEKLLIQEVCDEYNKKGIEEFGWGKGYVYVAEKFSKLLNALTELRNSGMDIVLVAHSLTRKFELPEEEGGFDKYELKLSKQVSALVKEWSDALLFLRYKTIVILDPNGKGKAQGNKRVIQTNHHAVWDAKNRLDLPEEMDFKDFIEYFYPASTPAPIEPEKTESEPEQKSEYHQKLKDLQLLSDISDYDLQQVVESHPRYGKVFPKGTTPTQWPEDFIQKTIIPAWEKISKTIQETKK